jgi:hypothetical protein
MKGRMRTVVIMLVGHETLRVCFSMCHSFDYPSKWAFMLDEWVKFDDAKVSLCDDNEIKKLYGGGKECLDSSVIM